MKSLVLGSRGQIGNHLCRYLQGRGDEVKEIDLLIDVHHDLRRYNNIELEQKIDDVDFVYFLAFDVGGSTYLQRYQNTFEFIDNNIKIMTTVFNMVKKYDKPFIFASSQMSNMDDSCYGLTKRIGEKWTEFLGGMFVKFWNIYGEEYDPDKFHVITDFILMADNDGIIKMKTDGREQRQFLYADDCCEALRQLALAYGDIDHKMPMDITSYEWTSIRQIADIVSDLNPGGAEIVEGNGVDHTQLIRNEPSRFLFDEGICRPRISLREGISNIMNSMDIEAKRQ